MRKNRFEQKLKDYLTVYKIPIAPNSLDPQLFYFPETGENPKLLPVVHAQIINDLESFVGEQPQRIKKYYLVGDALIPGNNNRKSELKVVIVLNKDLMDIDLDGLLGEELLKLANALSNRLVTGTVHPLRYTLTVRDVDPSEHEAIYDIAQHCWKKLPSGIAK
jgi:hypothetical protein